MTVKLYQSPKRPRKPRRQLHQKLKSSLRISLHLKSLSLNQNKRRNLRKFKINKKIKKKMKKLTRRKISFQARNTKHLMRMMVLEHFIQAYMLRNQLLKQQKGIVCNMGYWKGMMQFGSRNNCQRRKKNDLLYRIRENIMVFFFQLTLVRLMKPKISYSIKSNVHQSKGSHLRYHICSNNQVQTIQLLIFSKISFCILP